MSTQARHILVGMTDKRGAAWNNRAGTINGEPNYYPGGIPLEDVQRRLFAWDAIEEPVTVTDGRGGLQVIDNRKAILRNDTYQVLGVHSGSYAIHPYRDWLITNVGNLLDDELQVGGAGYAKDGRMAWVQVEMPHTSTAPGGVEYSPHLLAISSMDGSLATTYKLTYTIMVCDNQRTRLLATDTPEFRVRHTARSGLRIGDARAALEIVHQMDAEFEAEVRELLSRKVTDADWYRFVGTQFPVDERDSKQAQTRNENISNELHRLWNEDERVAPWRNTAYGVVQAANTYRQHIRPARRGVSREERNMVEVMQGVTERDDRATLELLEAVCV